MLATTKRSETSGTCVERQLPSASADPVVEECRRCAGHRVDDPHLGGEQDGARPPSEHDPSQTPLRARRCPACPGPWRSVTGEVGASVRPWRRPEGRDHDAENDEHRERPNSSFSARPIHRRKRATAMGFGGEREAAPLERLVLPADARDPALERAIANPLSRTRGTERAGASRPTRRRRPRSAGRELVARQEPWRHRSDRDRALRQQTRRRPEGRRRRPAPEQEREEDQNERDLEGLERVIDDPGERKRGQMNASIASAIGSSRR